MNTQQSLVELNKLFSILQTEIKNETTAGFSDIKSVLAETFLVEPLKLALNLPSLVSLNVAEKRNFPAVDLADDSEKVAIQVTSTAAISKIKKTVKTFHDHHLYTRFDTLYILILSDKKKYRISLSDMTEGKFLFGTEQVLDLSDVYKLLSEVQDAKSLSRIVKVLQEQMIGGELLSHMHESVVKTDLLHTNLLPIRLPSNLNIADLTLNKKEIEGQIDEGGKPPRYDRDYVRAMLDYHDVSMSRDFHCYQGKLITFKPVNFNALGDIGLINVDSAKSVVPKEFYTESLHNEIQFRHILRRSLQYQLIKDPQKNLWVNFGSGRSPIA